MCYEIHRIENSITVKDSPVLALSDARDQNLLKIQINKDFLTLVNPYRSNAIHQNFEFSFADAYFSCIFLSLFKVSLRSNE